MIQVPLISFIGLRGICKKNDMTVLSCHIRLFHYIRIYETLCKSDAPATQTQPMSGQTSPCRINRDGPRCSDSVCRVLSSYNARHKILLNFLYKIITQSCGKCQYPAAGLKTSSVHAPHAKILIHCIIKIFIRRIL